MSRGIPSVATGVGGIPQVIKNRETGFLVDVDDENALSNVLCDLLESQELRQSVGAAGRNRVALEFNVRHSIDRLVCCYEGLVSREEPQVGNEYEYLHG